MRIVANKKVARRKSWIYGLFDPRDNSLRYIGQCKSPRARWSNHCSCAGANPELSKWLVALKDAGLKPEMQVFGLVIAFSGDSIIDDSLAIGAEKHLINRMSKRRGTGGLLHNVRGTKKESNLRRVLYQKQIAKSH